MGVSSRIECLARGDAWHLPHYNPAAKKTTTPARSAAYSTSPFVLGSGRSFTWSRSGWKTQKLPKAACCTSAPTCLGRVGAAVSAPCAACGCDQSPCASPVALTSSSFDQSPIQLSTSGARTSQRIAILCNSALKPFASKKCCRPQFPKAQSSMEIRAAVSKSTSAANFERALYPSLSPCMSSIATGKLHQLSQDPIAETARWFISACLTQLVNLTPQQAGLQGKSISLSKRCSLLCESC